MMADGAALYAGCKRLGVPMSILTGLPDGKKFASDARRQKELWCARELDRHLPVITCMSTQKHLWSAKGNVLVDDRISHKARWEKNGGIFVHHTSAAASLEALHQIMESGAYAISVPRMREIQQEEVVEEREEEAEAEADEESEEAAVKVDEPYLCSSLLPSDYDEESDDDDDDDDDKAAAAAVDIVDAASELSIAANAPSSSSSSAAMAAAAPLAASTASSCTSELEKRIEALRATGGERDHFQVFERDQFGLHYYFGLPAALDSVCGKVGVLRPLVDAIRAAESGAASAASTDHPYVRLMLGHTERLVVIMRGLPGSGKSTIAQKLLEAWHVSYGTATAMCSADSFFEAGAGLSRRRLQELAQRATMDAANAARDPSASARRVAPDGRPYTEREFEAWYRDGGARWRSAPPAPVEAPTTVYRLVFDTKKLGAAHAHCRQQFTDGLSGGCGLVIVDNTNTTLEEYAYYRRTAIKAGYNLVVVEVVGRSSADEIEQLHARNSHGVPLEVMRAMIDRWQPDVHSRAVVRIRPQGLLFVAAPAPAPDELPQPRFTPRERRIAAREGRRGASLEQCERNEKRCLF